MLMNKKEMQKANRQAIFKEKIDKAIENGIELFSFDIFDTLITRTTATPQGIFALMQHQLQTNKKFASISDDIKNDFYYLRIGAENYLNTTKTSVKKQAYISTTEIKYEFSLEDFYSKIQYHHGLTDEQVQSLINLELETEYNNSLPISENIEILKYILSKNKKVVLISDMYLKSDFIRKLLLKHDDVFQNIKIYVSSEHNSKKGNGTLFKVVRDNEHIDYKKWFHTGDNKYSDVKAADNVHITTHWFEKEELSEFEENIFKNHRYNPYINAIIGTCKNTRYFNPNNTMADFATIATVILFPYVHWLVHKSLGKGITRLYFIARDGYVLKEIADIIIKTENLNITTKYIYGSRDAWRIPSVENFDDLWYIFRQFTAFSCMELLSKVLFISIEELKQFLPKYYKNLPDKKRIAKADLQIINSILSSNPDFINLILEKNKEKKELLTKYLWQEIDFSDDKFALVDLTGSGVTVDLLSQLIYKMTNIKSTNFMYNLSSNFNFEYTNIYTFHLRHMCSIVELFCRAPHGQAIGYKENNGHIEPMLAPYKTILNFEDYINGIKECTQLYINSLLTNNLLNTTEVFFEYYNFLLSEPTKQVASYFSNIPFEVVGAEKKQKNTKTTFMSLVDYYFFNNKHSIMPAVFRLSVAASPFHIILLDKCFQKMPKLNYTFFKKIKFLYKVIIQKICWG